MKESQQEVIILETKPFFEYDKRCVCFSKNIGKIVCLAKYAAKASKKKVWSLEPLTIASLTLFKGKSFQIIKLLIIFKISAHHLIIYSMPYFLCI
jgi:recombinational DNA repair protein (RecF pathway)